MKKTDRITRALALATAAFVSAPGAVQAGSHLRRRDPGRREIVPGIDMYLGGSISRVESNSNFGIGTVDFGGRRELFGASTPSWIDRGGFDVGVEVDLDKPGHHLDYFGLESRTSIRFGVSYATGSESNSGRATVGVGGVNKVALTFLEDAGSGSPFTGVFSDFSGDGLESFVEVDNDWTFVHLGWRESAPHPWAGGEAEFHIGGSIIYERFDQDFSGRADIVRSNVSLAGQRTRGETEDEYFGYEFNAGISAPITEKFSVGVEGYITPSWHSGEASLSQTTDLSGVTQRLNFSDDDFEVTGGIRTRIKYDFSPSASFKLSYEYSRLGGVSEVHVPANPGGQPAFFDSGSVERHFGRAEFEWQLPQYSDIRLKRDVVALARLDSGLKLYRFRYLWSDTLFVGVMAQEVAELMPDAVARGPDGFLRVDYARLGLAMQTWEEWAGQRRQAFGSTPIEVRAAL